MINYTGVYIELFHDGGISHIEPSKLMYWFLYDRDLRHEIVKDLQISTTSLLKKFKL